MPGVKIKGKHQIVGRILGQNREVYLGTRLVHFKSVSHIFMSRKTCQVYLRGKVWIKSNLGLHGFTHNKHDKLSSVVFPSNFAAYIVCRCNKPCEFLGFVWTPGMDKVRERGAPLPGNDEENWGNRHTGIWRKREEEGERKEEEKRKEEERKREKKKEEKRKKRRGRNWRTYRGWGAWWSWW